MFNKSVYNKISLDKTWLTVSNLLTVLRIALTPLITFGIFYEKWSFVFVLIFVVGASDFLDGFFARYLKQETNLGKMLDPIADKFLLITSFSSLAFLQSPSFPIPIWFVILILCREAIIILGTYSILKIGGNFKISPTIWGKLTTFFQLLFILWLFICYFFEWVPTKTYYVLLYLLALFSLLSLYKYIKIGIKYLRSFT